MSLRAKRGNLRSIEGVNIAITDLERESRGKIPSGGGLGVSPSFKKSPKIGGLGG